MLVVDPRHWLNPDGSLPTNNWRIRRNVLRVARLIEYAGNLAVGETRETLVDCVKRPGGKRCEGLLCAGFAPSRSLIPEDGDRRFRSMAIADPRDGDHPFRPMAIAGFAPWRSGFPRMPIA